MKAIYFPFTYVSPEAVAGLRRFFTAIAGYQPGPGSLPDEMRDLQASGFWEVIVPAGGDEQKVMGTLKGLRDWSEIHQGGLGTRTAHVQLSGRATTVEDPESESRIAAEIRQRSRPAAAADADPLFSSRLTLQLAQDFDLQCRGLRRDLDRQAELAAGLLRAIGAKTAAGVGPDSLHALGRNRFDGGRLTAGRVKAWSRLYLSHPFASPVFATSDAEVLDYLMEQLPDDAFMSAPLPGLLDECGSAAERWAMLTKLAVTPPDALERDFGFQTSRTADRSPGSAALFIVIGLPPLAFCARLADAGALRPEPPPSLAAGGHTLLAMIVPDSCGS
jgi:hypothetical protein